MDDQNTPFTLSRRSLLWGGMGALAAGMFLPAMPTRAARHGTGNTLLSSARDNSGRDHAVAWSEDLGIIWKTPLPGRAHGPAVSPDGTRAFLPARRPGHWATALDLTDGTIAASVECQPGRHFFGHAVYTADGRHILTTENAFDHGEGRIGIRDAHSYAWIGEFPSFGTEPHELAWMPDQRTLVVANGGILTSPESGRAKLNLGMTDPSLTYIDSKTGTLLEKRTLPAALRAVSLRHLAVAPDSTVIVACQYQGAATDHVPLVLLHRRGHDPVFPALPDAVVSGLRHYCGSALFSPDGTYYVVTSPVGGIAILGTTNSPDTVRTIQLPDVCGAAVLNGDLILTNGFGQILGGSFDAFDPEPQSEPLKWDNHAIAFSSPYT